MPNTDLDDVDQLILKELEKLRNSVEKLERRIDKLEQSEMKKKGIVAGIALASGGGMAAIVELLMGT